METSLKGDLINSFKSFKRVHSKFMYTNDLSPGEFFTLSVIDKLSKEIGTDESVYVNYISSKLQLSMPAISQILKSLEKKDLIIRGISLTDRRKVTVNLTESGEKSLENASKRTNYMLDQLIIGIGEKDIVEFIKIFTNMINIIEQCNEQEISNTNISKKDELI